jgi:hypothetical protein
MSVRFCRPNSNVGPSVSNLHEIDSFNAELMSALLSNPCDFYSAGPNPIDADQDENENGWKSAIASHPKLHFEPPRLLFERPRPSMAPYEPPQLLNF